MNLQDLNSLIDIKFAPIIKDLKQLRILINDVKITTEKTLTILKNYE